MNPISRFADHLATRFVPPGIAEADSETRRRARSIVLFSFAIFLCGPPYGAVYLALDMPVSALGALVCTVSLFSIPFIFRRSGSVILGAHLVTLGCYSALALVTSPTGGLTAPALAWQALLPVTSLMLGGKRAGLIWTVIAILTVVAYFILDRFGLTPHSEVAAEWGPILSLSVAAGLVANIALLAWLYESNKDRMLSELLSASEQLAQARDAAEAAHRDARRVLDHVHQALLIVDGNGHLGRERSRAVSAIFGARAEVETLWDLFAFDSAFADSLYTNYQQLFEDVLPRELLLAQLPTHCRLGNLSLEVQYVPVEVGTTLEQVLVIVTDVSAGAEARELLEKQQEQGDLFRHILRERKFVVAFYHDACDLVRVLLEPAHPLVEQLRRLHTLKGNAGFFGLKSLARCCHQIETEVQERRQAELTTEQRRQLESAFASVCATVDPFLAPLASDGVLVSRAEYETLLQRLRSIADQSLYERALLWSFDATAAELAHLAEKAESLSLRLRGESVQVIVEDEGVRLPPGKWSAFWSAAAHLIRNAVDHGLESQEEREEQGKPYPGRLWLRTKHDAEGWLFEVEDDGSGIDWPSVERRAQALGLPTGSLTALEGSLFADGLSTRTEVTETSGRGIGLAAVLAQCQARAGQVRIHSEPGRGTRFSFRFPGDSRHLASATA